MKEVVVIETLSKIYSVFFRDYLIEKAGESSTPFDNWALKLIDTLLGIK